MRVVVADDAMLTREGIVHLLDQAGVDVVAQADDADGLLREVVGGFDQQVAADAVELELGSGDLLVAAGGRSSTLGIRLPTPVQHEVKERLFAIDV